MIVCGSAREVLLGYAPNSFDAVVTDPPYEIGVLNRKWDSSGVSYDPSFWALVARVSKPGAHLVAFSSPRTYHKIASAIERGGWELRDQLMWIYASGFPKSMDMEKATGDESWRGWGTALKPAHEPIVLARKPVDGSITSNVNRWGVGALNLGACRVGSDERFNKPTGSFTEGFQLTKNRGFGGEVVSGRWAANVMVGESIANDLPWSRFFFVPKPTTAEREAGCSGLPPKAWSDGRRADADNPRLRAASERRNWHESVKPIDLMRYLVRLVSAPGARVIDPFVGSGTTAVACKLEGRSCVGIELREEVVSIARARVDAVQNGEMFVGPKDRVVVRKESEGQLDLF